MNYNGNRVRIQEQNELFNHLITRLPNRVSSWNSKEHFNLRGLVPTARALECDRWIEYNQSWVNMLIIDIDRPISLNDAINECLAIEFEPTWICKTDNGIHICFTLENMIREDWHKAIKLARHVKTKLTNLLKADKVASHRLKGIYRNPLLHEHYYSGLLYSLKDFKYLLSKQETPKKRFKKHTIKQKRKNNIFKYELGYRNEYVFRNAMVQSRDKNLSYDDTLELIRDIVAVESKSTGVEELEDIEIKRTSRMVKIYNDKDMNFVSANSIKQTKEVKRGSMGFEPICRGEYIEPEEHKRITKERQILSAKRTKDLDMTRVERAKANAVKREKETREKIENAISGLLADSMFKKKNGTWNSVAIAKYLKLDSRTVRKHLKALEKDVQ